MALALTACGGGNTTVAAPVAEVPSTPATPTTPTTPAPPGTSCAAANTHCAPQP